MGKYQQVSYYARWAAIGAITTAVGIVLFTGVVLPLVDAPYPEWPIPIFLAIITAPVGVFGGVCVGARQRGAFPLMVKFYYAAVGAILLGGGTFGALANWSGLLEIYILGVTGVASIAGALIGWRIPGPLPPDNPQCVATKGKDGEGVKGAILGFDRFLKRARRMHAFIDFVWFRFFIGIASVIGLYYLLHWTPSPLPPGPPENPTVAILTLIWSFRPGHLVVYGLLVLLIVLAIRDLWWFLVALLRNKPLEDEKAHGPAAEATERQAALHERGETRLPVHQQRFE